MDQSFNVVHEDEKNAILISIFTDDTTTYEFSHSEFEIIQTPTTFWQAKEVCAANGARLTEITDPKSENRLRKVVKL